MYLFWSYANVKRTSRSSRTTKKGEGGFFDSPVHVSLINILVAVWQRGKWLLSIQRSNILIFPYARQYQLTRVQVDVHHILLIYSCSLSRLYYYSIIRAARRCRVWLSRGLYKFLLWFRTTYDDIKFSSWMKHQICMLIRSRKYPYKRSTYSCYYVVQLIILPKNQ